MTGQIRGGTLKAIAVTSPQRYPSLSEVPTIAKSGLPGYDVTSWYGLAMAADTPKPIVDKINKALAEALGRQSVRKQIADVGAQPRSSTPEELSKHIEGEDRQVAQRAGKGRYPAALAPIRDPGLMLARAAGSRARNPAAAPGGPPRASFRRLREAFPFKTEPTDRTGNGSSCGDLRLSA